MGSAELRFEVQGREPEPYEVIFAKEGSQVLVTCTCAGAIYGRQCKHRISLIDGTVTGLVSDNESDVSRIAEMIKGSDVEVAHQEYMAAEKVMSAAKRRFDAAKKNLARTFVGE